MPKKVLVLEDESSIRGFIVINLTRAGYEVIEAESGEEALELLGRHTDVRVALLDIMLPGIDGFEVCRRIRATNTSIGIIMLTARSQEMDKVTGLMTGADDYVTKPFSLAVLRARVNAQLRRGAPVQPDTFSQDGFFFDFAAMEFTKNGVPVELSKTEQKLLRLLTGGRGATLSRDTLIDRIWTDGAAYVDENALSVTVKRLRGKLEDDPSKPRYLKTVYGLGYAWVVT